MRPIFISYRREDAEGEAGRLYDDLTHRLGEGSVFLDVAAIEVGRDFRKAIDESIAGCGVVLAVIGKDWIDAKDEAGHRRLEEPSDFVRLETASALKREIPVIPVLVQGARMPRPEQLPDDLKELAYRNGVELTHARWHSDVELLIKALTPHVVSKEKPEADLQAEQPGNAKTVQQARWWKSSWAIPVLILAALMAAAGAYVLLSAQRTVPDLTGNSVSEAAARLTDASLVIGNKAYEQNSEKAPDTVLRQSPLPNARVPRGTAVDVVLAQAPGQVEVPPLTGKTLELARQVLRDLHLAVGNISREQNTQAASNSVIDEFPKPGKKVDPGTAIDLVVAQPASIPEPPSGDDLANFAGRWVDTNDSSWHLEIQTQGARLAFLPGSTTATPDGEFTLNGIVATWSAQYRAFQLCGPKYQHQGFDYQVAATDSTRVVVKGTTLYYERHINWGAPCDGHPVTEQLNRTLQKQ